MKKYTFTAIEKLSDSELKAAHKENKNGLPKGSDSIIRVLQVDISKENGKTVPLSTVQYRVSMEVIERFCDIWIKYL